MAVVAPGFTVTLLGTVPTPVLLLVRVTTAPFGPAGPVNCTVPPNELPPLAKIAFSERLFSVAAVTVKPALTVAPPYDAEIVAVAFADTALVVMVKLAEVAPAAIITLAGTVAAAVLLLERAITAPPAGAADFNETVPVTLLPPTAELLLSVSVFSAAPGVTIRPAAMVVPPLLPEIVTAVDAVTTFVVTVNVAVVALAATVTLAGTVAAALLLASVTTAPPAGAAAVNVTVPVVEVPPTRLATVNFKALRRIAGVTVKFALTFTTL